MSSSSSNSGNGDSAPSHSNALALAPATASDASSSADAEGASAFVEADAVPKRPVVYRPFVATHEWQVIEHDHILPPGTRTHSGQQRVDSNHA
jgi:hypothetical protein